MTLKANTNYRRRITTLVSADVNLKKLAVMEYLGKHEMGEPHGNTKCAKTENCAEKAPYVRTPTETMDKIAELHPKMTARSVYYKLKREMYMDVAPRDVDVVRNARKNDLPNSAWTMALFIARTSLRSGLRFIARCKPTS
jgi:hypothetical protein